MRRDPPGTIADSIVTRPTTFEVGDHKVMVAKVRERVWTVAVDGRLLPGSFDSQADAWAIGVREVDRLGGPLSK